MPRLVARVASPRWLSWAIAGLVCAAAQAPWPSAAQTRPPGSVHAAAPLPPLPFADTWLRSAFASIDRNNDARAERLIETVLASPAGADPWWRAEAFRCRAVGALNGGRYAEATAALDEAEPLYLGLGASARLAMVWRTRAAVALQEGNRAKAQVLAQRALAELDRLGATDEVVQTLALLSILLDRREGGEAVLARGLTMAERHGLRRPLARLLQTQGDWRFGEGDFAGAVHSYERAERQYDAIGDLEGLGRVWTSLGRLNRAHGRHEAALDYYRRAYTALQRAGDQAGVIQAVNAIATALANMGRLDEARGEYERALRLAEANGAARIVNFQRGNLGGHYLRQGDYARAIPLLRESADQESNPLTQGIRRLQLGEAFKGAGEVDQAIGSLDQAVAVFRQQGNRERLFGALAARAEAYRRLGRREEALADVRASLEVLEEVRRQLAPSDFLRRGFHQYTRDYAALGIRILTDAGRDGEALEVSEQARARAFLDLLAARPQLAAAGHGTATERGDSRALPAPPTASPSAQGLLLTTDRPQAGEPAPVGSRIDAQASTRAATVAEIVTEAKVRRSTLLNYWVDTSRTHIWVVTPDGSIRHAAVEVADRELVRLIRALWTGLAPGPAPEGTTAHHARTRGAPGPDDDGPPPPAPALSAEAPLSPRRAARELYRLLVAPVAAHLPAAGATLTIVPDGPLFRLSFAALLDDRDRYLVERYALAYGPSVSVLGFTRAMAGRRASSDWRYLFVADPSPLPAAPGDPLALPPLPGTIDEVRQITARLPAAASRTLVGNEATETAVSRALPSATAIHFATHGIVRDDDPFGSFLALGADGIGSAHDGALTAEEIYGVPLQARLVVLSACRSGLGEVSADGIVGLTRAFFFAGTPSVVATLWDVADDQSAHLLRDFYAALSRGDNLARALRSAQLSMLADLRAGRVTAGGATGARVPERPVFWASFVLMGEP